MTSSLAADQFCPHMSELLAARYPGSTDAKTSRITVADLSRTWSCRPRRVCLSRELWSLHEAKGMELFPLQRQEVKVARTPSDS